MTEQQTVALVDWLGRIWDEEERQFEDACEAEAEYLRSDGIPDATAASVREFWLSPEAGTEWPLRLARIAADRKILEHCAHAAAQCPEGDWPDGDMSWAPLADQARHIMRLLASPYKGREGWQESWDE